MDDRHEQIRVMLAQGKRYSEIGPVFGISSNAVRHIFRRNRDKWNPDKPTEQENPDNIRAIQLQRENAKRQAQIDYLKKLTERRAVIEEWRDALKGAALTVESPKLLPYVANNKSFDDESAVLILSDVHVGQHTPGRINGGWDQTIETTENQFTMLSQKLLQAWEIQKRSTLWKALHILDLGDDVENSNMRASQHRIADPLVTQQTAIYGRLLAELVLKALVVFPKVIIDRIPGNHGRTTQKPGTAGLSELDPCDSFDWLAGEFTRQILKKSIDVGRVELNNHDGFWGVTEIAGHRIVFEHGSSLRGSGSYGGLPYYGIDMAAAKYRDLEGPFSLLALGHYHRPYDLPTGFNGRVVGNGAFPPTTPFIAGTKHVAIRPSQTLLSIHRDIGITMLKRLYLDTPRETR